MWPWAVFTFRLLQAGHGLVNSHNTLTHWPLVASCWGMRLLIGWAYIVHIHRCFTFHSWRGCVLWQANPFGIMPIRAQHCKYRSTNLTTLHKDDESDKDAWINNCYNNIRTFWYILARQDMICPSAYNFMLIACWGYDLTWNFILAPLVYPSLLQDLWHNKL